ncbi:hypothetical protein BC833DRAFT_597162 [Globomyces pollinis-pini]|nr:hypothetical protein BC833DRAFT_597162 [Globomyces pollinis-pini]
MEPGNIGVSLRHMYKRELLRKSNGHYVKSNSEELWTFLLVFTFAFMVGFVIWGANGVEFYLQNWKELEFLGFSFPAVIYIIFKLSLILRWVLYWIIVTTALFFFMSSNQKDILKGESGKFLFSAFIIVESITIFIYIFQRAIYPPLVHYWSKNDAAKFWNIKPDFKKEGYYSCKRNIFRKRNKFSYVGQLNSNLEPNGFGKWTSQWALGECLSGFWENGKPIGPFKSREYRTGYSFANVRIGYASITDADINKNTFNFLPDLVYGVSGVECSVSGKFFSDLPRTNMILEHTDDLQEAIDKIIHFSDIQDLSEDVPIEPIATNLSVICTSDGFDVKGYVPIAEEYISKVNISRLQNNPNESFSETKTIHDFSYFAMIFPTHVSDTFRIDGWVKKASVAEAFVFIPGFNSTLVSSMKLVGQFISLGTLSSSFKPFIYVWPGGSLLGFGKAVQFAEHETTKAMLIKFIKELGLKGFEKIHLVCHSMGARVALNALDDFDTVFETFNQKLKRPRSACTLNSLQHVLPTLASFTLLNPEAELVKFCKFQYEQLRKFTKLITLYGSGNDIALISAEYILWIKELGAHPYRLVHQDPVTVTVEHIREDIESLTSDTHHIPLDMDVINCSDLDMNVHVARHAYFNLNKYVVDDIIDLMTTGKRAHDRDHRLLNIESNVYGFLSAPSYVVSA